MKESSFNWIGIFFFALRQHSIPTEREREKEREREGERERERERERADSVCVRHYLPCCSGEISLDMITLVITMPSEIPNPMTGAETQFVAKNKSESL